jgi:hypothetical protein
MRPLKVQHLLEGQRRAIRQMMSRNIDKAQKDKLIDKHVRKNASRVMAASRANTLKDKPSRFVSQAKDVPLIAKDIQDAKEKRRLAHQKAQNPSLTTRISKKIAGSDAVTQAKDLAKKGLEGAKKAAQSDTGQFLGRGIKKVGKGIKAGIKKNLQSDMSGRIVLGAYRGARSLGRFVGGKVADAYYNKSIKPMFPDEGPGSLGDTVARRYEDDLKIAQSKSRKRLGAAYKAAKEASKQKKEAEEKEKQKEFGRTLGIPGVSEDARPLTLDQLDEIVQALPAIAMGVGRGVVAGARAVGSAVGSLARGTANVGKRLKGKAKGAAKEYIKSKATAAISPEEEETDEQPQDDKGSLGDTISGVAKSVGNFAKGIKRGVNLVVPTTTPEIPQPEHEYKKRSYYKKQDPETKQKGQED